MADFRRVALAAGLAIVSTLLVGMASRAIFPNPERPKCEREIYSRPASEKEATEAEKAAQQDCQRQIDEADAAEKSANKNQFFVILSGSVLLLLAGGALYSVPVLSNGILWGGVVTMFVALTFSFQPGIEDYWRLGAAIVAFIVLATLAYKLFGKERENKPKTRTK